MPTRIESILPTRPAPSPSTRTPERVLGHRLALAAALALASAIGFAGEAGAFAPETPTASHESVVLIPEQPAFESVIDRAAPAESRDESSTWMERISRELRRIPLRPVTIGETPRTPDDPDPGAGVTVLIRF